MTWMITNTGREHHLMGIGQQLNTPSIEEIAHALAQINRFTGHCKRPYSVAEHSQEVAVHNALGIRSTMVAHRASIKRWDLIALATERRDLIKFNPSTSKPWRILDTPGQEVQPYPRACLNKPAREKRQWHEWADLFLREYAFLADEVRRTTLDTAHG